MMHGVTTTQSLQIRVCYKYSNLLQLQHMARTVQPVPETEFPRPWDVLRRLAAKQRQDPPRRIKSAGAALEPRSMVGTAAAACAHLGEL